MAAGVAGLILAGGSGTRFGGPKAFGELPGGRTFLAACVETLADAGVAPIMATLPPDRILPDTAGFQAVALPAAGLPMFESIRVGLGRLLAEGRWDRVVVLPVDHPLVTAASVRSLAAAGADAAIPVYRGKHGHPVAFTREVAERIVSGALPGPTLREVMHAVRTTDVPVDDAGVTANCNTPAALAVALGGAPHV